MRLSALCLEDRLAPAAGDFDPTFNGTGISTTVVEPNYGLSDVALAPDGGLFVFGSRADPSPSPPVVIPGPHTYFVARLLPDGRPDPSFGVNGRATLPSERMDNPGRMVALPDGGLLFSVIESSPDAVTSDLYRVSPDGKSVTEVGYGGVDGFAVHPTTGEVYLLDTWGVGFVPENTPIDAVVTRLDRDFNRVGSVHLDTSGGADYAEGIAIDATGRVYVVSTGQDTRVGVARVDADLNPASVVNRTYDVGTRVSYADVAVGLGGVYVTGAVYPEPAVPASVVLRLRPDLQEQAQSTVEVGARVDGRSITTDAAGRVVVVGTTATLTANGNQTPGDYVVARLNPVTLTPDTEFAGTGRKVIDVAPYDAASAVVVDSANRIVVVGNSSTLTTPRTATGAVIRLPGTPGVPLGLLVGGPSDGTALGLMSAGGKYAVETPVALFGGDAVSIRPATADVTGDGVPDIIGGTGPGAAARVTLIDGASRKIVAILNPFEPSFTGGVFVAAADVDGDGTADVVVTPDRGGGPVVAVYSGAKLTAGQDDAQIARFFGIEDPNFRGGARPAAGDINGDGKADVVAAAGHLGGPRVAVFDGAGVAAGGETPPKLVADFFAFEEAVRNGAFVAAGDVTGDGKADLAFGGGPGGGPRVRVFDGAKLLAAGPFATLDEVGPAQVANFFAGDESRRGGVRVALRDADSDGLADLHVGSGEGEPSRLRVYTSGSLLSNATPTAGQELDPYGTELPEGVFVG